MSSVHFSMQYSTLFCEHVRLCSNYLRKNHGLRYNAYTILLCLLEASRPVTVTELADYLMLSRETVLPLLLSLEDKGLVSKTCDSVDGRRIQCALTPAGKDAVLLASKGISEMLEAVFMASLPMDEFARFFSDIDAATAALRGHEVPGFGAHAPGTKPVDKRAYLFPSGHFVEWRVVVDRWKACVREHLGISFDEFRILELVGSRGSMALKDVASCLCIQKSGVSLYKKNLVDLGLLLEKPNPYDRRGAMVHCSPKASRLIEGMRARLDTIMDVGHVGMSETQRIVVEAWYMRMYSNMRTAAQGKDVSRRI